jgi:hypothetical protein
LNDLNLGDLSVQSDRAAIIERLLSHAVSLEYADNMDKYNVFSTANQEFNRQDSENPLEHIDCNCDTNTFGLFFRTNLMLNLR